MFYRAESHSAAPHGFKPDKTPLLVFKHYINNSALYKEEGIALWENWQNSQESDFDNSVHDESECNFQVEASNTDSETLSTFNDEKQCDDIDEWSENEQSLLQV